MALDRTKEVREPSRWGRSGLRRVLVVAIAVIGLAFFLSACTVPPSGVTVTVDSQGTITLSWNPVEPDQYCDTIVGYNVYMGFAPGAESSTPLPNFDTNPNPDVTTQETTYAIRGESPATYYFTIKTVGSDGPGDLPCGNLFTNEYVATIPFPGTGMAKVTLSWSSTADLDLHVVEPNGEEIYYGNTVSSDGGTYGVDANGGCSNTTTSPQETVTWPNVPPSGTYTVKVVYYEPCPGGVGSQNFNLNANVNGVTVLYENGTVNNQGDEQDYTFTVS